MQLHPLKLFQEQCRDTKNVLFRRSSCLDTSSGQTSKRLLQLVLGLGKKLKNRLKVMKISIVPFLFNLFQGGEDDDFYNRLVAKNMSVIREPTEIGR